MISKEIKRVRCDDVLTHIFKICSKPVFATFTTKDVVSLIEMRKRWRSLRHYLVEKYGRDFKYVMNYELHPGGHGWHIHGVFTCPIDLKNGGLSTIQSFGFGRVDVRYVTNKGVAEYLTKHCLKAYRGVRNNLNSSTKRLRLVNCSRGFPRLCDYFWKSKVKEELLMAAATDFPRLSHRSIIWRWQAAQLSRLFELDTNRATDLVLRRLYWLKKNKKHYCKSEINMLQ